MITPPETKNDHVSTSGIDEQKKKCLREEILHGDEGKNEQK